MSEIKFVDGEEFILIKALKYYRDIFEVFENSGFSDRLITYCEEERQSVDALAVKLGIDLNKDIRKYRIESCKASSGQPER